MDMKLIRVIKPVLCFLLIILKRLAGVEERSCDRNKLESVPVHDLSLGNAVHLLSQCERCLLRVPSADLLLVWLQGTGYCLEIHSPALHLTVVFWFYFFQRKGGFFVDLFVRVSNQVAVNMYKQLGYSVYRTVLEYYSASSGEPDEDAYGEYLFCLRLNGKIVTLRIPGLVSIIVVFFI